MYLLTLSGHQNLWNKISLDFSYRELKAIKVAEGTQAFMFETSLQLAVTKVIFSSISVTHFMQSSNKKKSITNMVFTVGGGDLSEVGPCLLRVLATTQE